MVIQRPTGIAWINPKIQVRGLHEPPDDVRFWLTRPIEEHFEAIEYMRWMNHGQEAVAGRLPRLLEIA